MATREETQEKAENIVVRTLTFFFDLAAAPARSMYVTINNAMVTSAMVVSLIFGIPYTMFILQEADTSRAQEQVQQEMARNYQLSNWERELRVSGLYPEATIPPAADWTEINGSWIDTALEFFASEEVAEEVAEEVIEEVATEEVATEE